MKAYYERDGIRIFHARCEEVLPELAASSVDLIATDPPYHKVKSADWDNQWENDAAFIAWISELCQQWKRVLKPNGSLYCFASPQMAARVECEIGKHFNVLNHIVWRKEFSRHNQSDKDILRGYFPQTERVIFAENFGSDEIADGEAGYTSQCENLKRSVFGEPLQAAMQKLGMSHKEVAELTKCYGKVNHGGAVSNWLIGYNCPTADQWEKLRGVMGDLIPANYESLRQNYESLRQNYESLRRPFVATPTTHYTDVWEFPTVTPYKGKHECEKPLSMMEHIIRTSSRPDAVVLDCFLGSGTALHAARNLGRQGIGVEMQEHWCRRSVERLQQPTMFEPLPPVERPRFKMQPKVEQLELTP